MRHWLPALLAAQIAGILCVDRMGPCAPWGVAVAAALALSAIAIAIPTAATRTGIAMGAATFAAFAIGGVALATRTIDPARIPTIAVGERVTLDVRVEGVVPTSGRLALELAGLRRVEGTFGEVRPPVDERRSERPSTAGASGPSWPGRVRLYVDASEPAFAILSGASEGDRLRVRVAVRPIDGPRNPGARDRSGSSLRRDVWATATLAHDAGFAFIDRGRARPRGGFALRRAQGVERLARRGDGGRVLAALGLGARDVLSPPLRDALSRLGLSHLVAVSGLHLLMVASLAFAAAAAGVRLLRIGAWIDPTSGKIACAVVAAAGYAWLSGFGVPARRALVLLVVALSLHAAGRRSAWPSAWCVAAAGVLAMDPASLFELGAQLSFGVTAALAWASMDDAESTGPAAAAWASWLDSLLRVVRASAVAIAASAWILACHGMPSSAWALVANSIAVPLTGAVLLPGALLAGGLAFCEGGRLVAPALDGLAAAAGVLVAAAEAAAARVPLPSPPVPSFVVLAPALLALVGSVRASSGSMRCAAALACTGWIAWAGASSSPPDPSRGPELIAFDVGQGDATLLRGGGAAILVDAGWASPEPGPGGWDAGERVVVPALRSLGIDHLDLLVVTHADLDHRGGARAVLAGLDVDRVWVPAPSAADPAFAALHRMAVERGAAWEPRSGDGRIDRFGPFGVEPLWPRPGAAPASRNESCLVLSVGVGESRVLLMGDAGVETERALLAHADGLRADVLKLGHHGSRTSTSEAFLAAVSPRVAIVSAGCGVGRALPHPETLSRLAAARVPEVGWTGRDGALRYGLGELARPVPFEWAPRRRRCGLDEPP